VNYSKLLKLAALTELLAICFSLFGAALVTFDPAMDTPVVSMVIMLHAGVWTIASLFLVTAVMLDVINHGK
jgi:hypothetical protein